MRDYRKKQERTLGSLQTISRKEEYIFNPPPEMEIKEGDALILTGNVK